MPPPCHGETLQVARIGAPYPGSRYRGRCRGKRSLRRYPPGLSTRNNIADDKDSSGSGSGSDDCVGRGGPVTTAALALCAVCLPGLARISGGGGGSGDDSTVGGGGQGGGALPSPQLAYLDAPLT